MLAHVWLISSHAIQRVWFHVHPFNSMQDRLICVNKGETCCVFSLNITMPSQLNEYSALNLNGEIYLFYENEIIIFNPNFWIHLQKSLVCVSTSWTGKAEVSNQAHQKTLAVYNRYDKQSNDIGCWYSLNCTICDSLTCPLNYWFHARA